MAYRRKNRYLESLGSSEDNNPLSLMANLFDVAMVFAVALMVAFVVRMKMTEFLTDQDVSFVKNAGKKDMEIIVKKKNKIERYKAENSQKKATGDGKGKRVGIAYQLDNGDIIYIPE
ncbi:DUF2149 domain-containing protein [Lentisphaerota bacterium WC36G]|nr:DUF2149 domain-containing protein [Lentisphaerae bacterium WC36]